MTYRTVLKDQEGFPWDIRDDVLDAKLPPWTWFKQSKVLEVDGVWSCDLDDCDVAVVNAIRRCLLTDIPVVCFRTESEAVNRCRIDVNTSRMHNEMLKHRLSCVPVHVLPEDGVHEGVEVVLDRGGEGGGEVTWVTTEHLQVREKATGVFWDQDRVRRLFPPNARTGMFIDLVRLRAGERVAFVAELSVATARDNAMFNAVALCTYEARMDMKAVMEEAERVEGKEEKADFMALEAARRVLPGAWTFRMSTVGVRSCAQLWDCAWRELMRRVAGPFTEITHAPPCLLLSHTHMDTHIAALLAMLSLRIHGVRFAAPFRAHPHAHHSSLKIHSSFPPHVLQRIITLFLAPA